MVDPDFQGIDDLVGVPSFDHAILVNTRGVGEGIGPDDGFIGLYQDPHAVADQLADRVQQPGVHPGRIAQIGVLAQDHDHFFQRCIARPFANAINRAFDLAGALLHAGDRIGSGQSQVVMAVGGERGALDAADIFEQITHFCSVLVRQAIARGIGDVEHRGARLNGDLEHAGQELIIRPSRVFGVELYVFHEAFGQPHGRRRPVQNVFRRGLQFVTDVDLGDADAGVDTGPVRPLQGLGRRTDVLLHRTGKTADDGLPQGCRYGLHRLEIAGAGNGKTRFDHVDAERFQGQGNFDFLGGVQFAAGHLFPVAEGGIKDLNSGGRHKHSGISGPRPWLELMNIAGDFSSGAVAPKYFALLK